MEMKSIMQPTQHSDSKPKDAIQHIELTSQDDSSSISPEHQQYLLDHHGTLDLDPIPDPNDDDPYNWPQRKKTINILLVAFHAMMATFTASAIQSAFVDIAADLHVSVQKASYLTSLVIAFLGVSPLFWRPLSNAYGRRPIFLISLIGSLIGNIGCAVSPSYATMGLCRAITAFFISPAAALGSATVSEMVFKHQRARYLGIWTVMVTLGVPLAPFIFGFVALRVSYRWIYWTLACVNAVQFTLWFFFGNESRYIRGQTSHPSQQTFVQKRFHYSRIDATPLTLKDFLRPLTMFSRLCVLIPIIAYSMEFCIAGVFISIEIPQLYPAMFGFNTQQVGLQNLAIVVGSLLGEVVGGFSSDMWMSRRKHHKGRSPTEYRLWLSYPGYLLAICGLVVFLVCLDQAGDHWNITPTIGAGIAAAGNQIVTTVLITYAVDCYTSEAASIGVFTTFVRQIWGFIGPFWFPQMITNVGLIGSTGITTALLVGASIIPTMWLQWKGSSHH